MSPPLHPARDGNKTAIPDAYLPKEYVPRSIRVETVPGDPESDGRGERGTRREEIGESVEVTGRRWERS
jgi:hypothetical protein